jgi:putative DNA-invertase from lambdoid prophage Rac
MKVYAYIRVSTAEQASNGESLDTQRRRAIGYAMMKGWDVAAVFVEAGVSGSMPLADRPEDRKLLAAVEPGDAIITPKLDRMFRSASDALGTLEELKGQGIQRACRKLGSEP